MTSGRHFKMRSGFSGQKMSQRKYSFRKEKNRRNIKVKKLNARIERQKYLFFIRARKNPPILRAIKGKNTTTVVSEKKRNI